MGKWVAFLYARQRRWVTTEEIAPPVHVGEMGEAALVTDGGDWRGSFFYFMGSSLCFERITRLKGEGEMRSEEKWWGSKGSMNGLTEGYE